MRNPRTQWQLESDTAASRGYRVISIYFVLIAVLTAGALAQSRVMRAGTGVPGTGAANQNFSPPHNGMRMQSLESPSGNSGDKVITLNMPPEAQAGTLKVVLNGKDVSDRFDPTSCENAVCTTGTLSSSDGLRPGKNVLYAVAKSEGGKVVSSRLRFAGEATRPVWLSSLPGIGRFLSVVVRWEVDNIERFGEAKKFASYTGLVPSTYASSNRTVHGRLTKRGNKWLRWAFIEAVTPAVRSSAKLRAQY